MHQALLKLLNEGTFELKAREVPAFLKVYHWVKDMPDNWKIESNSKGKRKTK